jgi:hypothetical protein
MVCVVTQDFFFKWYFIKKKISFFRLAKHETYSFHPFWSQLVVPCKAVILVVSLWGVESVQPLFPISGAKLWEFMYPFRQLGMSDGNQESMWIWRHVGSVQCIEVSSSYQEMSKDVLRGVIVVMKLEQKVFLVGCSAVCKGKLDRILKKHLWCFIYFQFHVSNRYIYSNLPYFVNLKNSLGWGGDCINIRI